MNEDFYSYFPTDEELERFEKKMKNGRFSNLLLSIAFATIFIGGGYWAIIGSGQKITFSNFSGYFMLFLSAIGLYVLSDGISACFVPNVNNLRFTTGEVINAWHERKNSEALRSTHYITVKQSNGVLNKRIKVATNVFEFIKNAEVIMAFDKKGKIVGVISKEDYEADFKKVIKQFVSGNVDVSDESFQHIFRTENHISEDMTNQVLNDKSNFKNMTIKFTKSNVNGVNDKNQR